MRAALAPTRPRPAATEHTPATSAALAVLAPTRPRPAATEPTPATSAALGLLALALVACAAPPESSPAPPPGVTADVAPPAAPIRTANNDARGVGLQPDYQGEATLLRERVLPRLPDPLPASRAAACTAMLDAVAAFYAEVEPEEGPRTQLLADLRTSRPADLASCERETSVRAASCVRLRLADRDAEYPWLLDQCSRAFPE